MGSNNFPKEIKRFILDLSMANSIGHLMDLNSKKSDLVLNGQLVFLKLVCLADCTDHYLKWLDDPEINCYLETRWTPQSIETIKQFVSTMISSTNDYLFAIRDTTNGQHIGNIKVGPINHYHNYADISYFIGERSAWGKGFATEALQLVTKFAFEQLKLHRLQAGLYAENTGSIRALEKAGYQYEAVFKRQLRLGSSWSDHLWYSISNEML